MALQLVDPLLQREIFRLRASYQRISFTSFCGLYISDEQVNQLVILVSDSPGSELYYL